MINQALIEYCTNCGDQKSMGCEAPTCDKCDEKYCTNCDNEHATVCWYEDV